MEYSSKIAQAIEDYLKEQSWIYEFDTHHGTFSVEAELSCKLNTALMVTQVQEKGFLCYTALSVGVPPQSRALVGEYLHRANYGLPNGNFEFDYDDGTIHYKTSFDCPDERPTPAQLEQSLAIPLTVIDHYGDGLLTVLEDGASLVRRAIEAVDSDLR